MNIIGYLESYTDKVLVGWAFAPDKPGQRLLLTVEIEGEPCAAGLANLDRHDVAQAGHGDGRCGFRIPVYLPPGTAFLIREASTGVVLFTQEQLNQLSTDAGNADPGTSLVQGHVDLAMGTSLRGWCWTPTAPSSHLEVEASVDGNVVARAIADEMRGDLVNAGIGDGDHAFTLLLPYWMLDGVERTIDVSVQGQPLDGSPINFVGLTATPQMLLRHLTDAIPAPSAEIKRTAATLDTYLRQVDLVQPRSIGFTYYQEWLAAQLEGHPWAAGPAVAEFADGKGGAVRLRDAAGQTMIAIIDEGVRAMPHAIPAMMAALTSTGADAVYADAQSPTPGGLLPWFRPNWSYDLCLAQDYTRGVSLFRETALRRPDGIETLAGVRVATLLACDPARIHHMPEVVCTLEAPETPTAMADTLRAVSTHLSVRTQGAAQVHMIDANHGLRRVDWPMPADPPLVSLLIPTRDKLDLLRTAVDSITQRTRYDRFEIIIIDNQSRESATLEWLEAGQRRGLFSVVHYDAPFNFSAMNNLAAAQASGDIVGFINNDVELISPDWLEAAVSLLARPEVGAVGARLRFANGMIQHGGVIVGTGGLAENAFQQVHVDDEGYFHRTRVAGNYSAVTAACLFCHRSEFLEMGGFDAKNLPVAFNDVDFCLRLRERKRQIVWTPHMELYHYESVSRGRDNTPEKLARALKEELYMRQRWGRETLLDPFYNPNLNLDLYPFTGLAVPSRHRWGEAR